MCIRDRVEARVGCGVGGPQPVPVGSLVIAGAADRETLSLAAATPFCFVFKHFLQEFNHARRGACVERVAEVPKPFEDFG
eukprot:13246012-Alexandrium_andersonii.AAC.1